MKSYYDKHGNKVQGTTILQDILMSDKKTKLLQKLLEKLDMHIVVNANVNDKDTLWIKRN